MVNVIVVLEVYKCFLSSCDHVSMDFYWYLGAIFACDIG